MKKIILLLLATPILFTFAQDQTKKDSTGWSAEQPTKWDHKIDWFEIPVINFERAKKFYETIFEIEMKTHIDTIQGFSMAFFADPANSSIVSGALVKGKDYIPSDKGVLIYLNANPDLNEILDSVKAEEGTRIVMAKTQISPEIGYMAIFIDTEGNKIALHSQK
ncbi:VOC family protein [Bacteroidales bacterium AH-315-N07]|nr:VOC family protein [Bacteroidales bacterium AH-315-N07]